MSKETETQSLPREAYEQWVREIVSLTLGTNESIDEFVKFYFAQYSSLDEKGQAHYTNHNTMDVCDIAEQWMDNRTLSVAK